ncbi:MAG: histidine kinase dimerization/phospho-acceptor domain-containing protein [Bacilli bacterium]
MDIKLKNNNILRILNIILLLVMVIVLPIQLSKDTRYNSGEKNIYKIDRVRNYLINFDRQTSFKNKYVSEDGTPRPELVESRVVEIKSEQEPLFNASKEYIESQRYNADENINKAETERLIEESRVRIMVSEEKIREQVMMEFEREFNEIKKALVKDNRNIGFYCENPESGFVITNVPGAKAEDFIVDVNNEEYEYINKVNGVDIGSTDELESIAGGMYGGGENNKEYNRYYRIPKNLAPGDLLYDIQEEQYLIIAEYDKNLAITAIMNVIFLVSLVLAFIGRKKVNSKFLDKCYDFLPIEIKVITPLIVVYNAFIIDYNMVRYMSWLLWTWVPFQIIALIISYKFISEIITKGVTKINYENMKKRSIFYNLKIVITKFVNLIKDSFLVKSTKIRVIIAIVMTILFYVSMLIWNRGMSVGLPVKLFITFFSYIYPIIMIIYILNIAKGLNLLKISTDKIVDGDYNVNINVRGPIIVKDIASNIKNIEDGFGKAVEEAVKSEKLKGELITNVSHDLKTPLTSIISYVDLLKNDNLKEEDRKKYINVLDGKAQRLKVLIEDLFEASKASSGSMEIQKENIDVSSLLRQTLGEFQEKISTSSLEFINKWPEEKAELYLDGKKTWRVFENLISNILKYSMENSRVYIEVIKNEDNVQIIMKNMSAYQLDFTEEEVIERFKRGDKSRHTEGSGLGLAIAKSLVELQGGTFKIEIDGDLFKVRLMFSIEKDKVLS